jgi:hypothetical protein
MNNHLFRPEDRSRLAIVIIAAMTVLLGIAISFSDSRSLHRQNDEINAGN